MDAFVVIIALVIVIALVTLVVVLVFRRLPDRVPSDARGPYKYYDVKTFFEEYAWGLVGDGIGDGIGSEIMNRKFDAALKGQSVFKVYDDEMAIVLKRKANYEEFNRKLCSAADLNNQGLAAEKEGDIDTAVSLYEQNILPDTYFTLNPYYRLCVIYRRAKDYDNELRVISICLGRLESIKGYDKDRAFYKDRLDKVQRYKSKRDNGTGN